MATKKITLNEIKKLIQKEIHRQFLNENELDELFFSSGTPPTGFPSPASEPVACRPRRRCRRP